MRKLLFIIMLGIFSLTHIAKVEAAGKQGTAPEVTLIKVKKAPVIDGKLDDVAWYGAVYYKSIFPGYFAKSYKQIAKWQPIAYVVYDDENLYVGYSCPMPPGAKLTAKSTPEKFSWRDDIVQIFLEPKLNLTYTQLAVNSRGISSMKGVKAAALTEDGMWQAEMAIPWKLLEAKKVSFGKTMGFNVIAYQSFKDGGGWLSWMPLFKGAHTPEKFGRIVLGKIKYIPFNPRTPNEDDF